MRWKIKPYHSPKEGEKRTVHKFAFLPVRCGEVFVWLEPYDSFQVYQNRLRATKAGPIYLSLWDEVEIKIKEKNT